MAFGSSGNSGFGANNVEGGNGFAQVLLSNLGSDLIALLLAEDIVPGSPIGYQTAKTIYSYHPLGKKLADTPVRMAQSQAREINVAEGPSELLVEAFKREWLRVGKVGADSLIANTMIMARVYGIASLGCGERGKDSVEPFKPADTADVDLFFNVFDPLNTAGSLVLNQDPNSPDFQKPIGLSVAGRPWHHSRVVVMMNEQPVYIEWSDSAFGFVGRSVYQRALYPLKTFVQSMITDDMVTKKIGLLIWAAKTPTSTVNNRLLSMFGWKRGQLQGGATGNVLQIGADEKIESLNFQNLEGAGRFTRENCIKNIGAAAGMPARLIDQETLSGNALADGSEDAKQIARYIEGVRTEMQPLYMFMDDIVQHRAWSKAFYKTVQKQFSEYKNVPYETAFYDWKNSFSAVWPNLLAEPESKKVEVDDVRFKAVAALVEVLSPLLEADVEASAELIQWAAEQANERKELFGGKPLDLDHHRLMEALKEAKATKAAQPGFGAGGTEGGPDEEPRPKPFSMAA